MVSKISQVTQIDPRARTSLSQRLPEKLEEWMAAFLSNVQQQRRSGRYPAAMISNMDETPVYFDLIPNKMIDRVGTKSCIVRSTGSEKRHITVVLTVTANGCMLPPMIIFKGKRALKLNVPEGVVVAVQEKAWMTKK